jgi:hypothetical protein
LRLAARPVLGALAARLLLYLALGALLASSTVAGVQAVQVLWLSVWLSAVGCSNNIQSSSNMIRP